MFNTYIRIFVLFRARNFTNIHPSAQSHDILPINSFFLTELFGLLGQDFTL